MTTKTVTKSLASPPRKRSKKVSAVVYVSPYCGESGKTFRNVCQAAMDELRDKGVPFVERDIFDPRYRDEYVQKMESIGRRPPAVPLIDVEGHLVLGSHGVLSRAISGAREGAKPQRYLEIGATKPPSPKRPVYEPGETWVEPSDSPAILYGAKYCPHCPAARKFLKKHGVKFNERSQAKPKHRAEVKAHAKRFGSAGGTAPSMYMFGRFLDGLDYQSIEGLVHWRRGARKRSSATPATKATNRPTAIVYVSPYCGKSHDVCEVAMEELKEDGVSFVKRDIFDARYRGEYVRKMQSIGRRPPAVPLIDIEGRLVLGADGSLNRVILDARKGIQSQTRYPVGFSKPPAPVERLYEPGETWLEPPDSSAVIYGSSKRCSHCGRAAGFLNARGVDTVKRDTSNPTGRAERHARQDRFGNIYPMQAVYIFGRLIDGLDEHSLEALIHWRRTERRPAPRATK